MKIDTNRRHFLNKLLTIGSIAWITSKNANEIVFAGNYDNPVSFLTTPLTSEVDRAIFEVNNNLDPYSVFGLSVASGDPREHGIVLWTRINPESVVPNNYTVGFQISNNQSFAISDIIIEGIAPIDPEKDCTIKLPIENSALAPFTTYHYRFIYNNVVSHTGKFKTLPSQNSTPTNIKFAYLSCQDYAHGYYSALNHLAKENLDFIIHLGDYIYETPADPMDTNPQVRPLPVLPNNSRLPSGNFAATTLEDYRYLYRIYKSDRNLQAVHENFTTIQLWDDHEFQNDGYGSCAPDRPDLPAPCQPDLRQAATRAWFEYSASNVTFDPTKPANESISTYRSFKFGRLMEVIATDERLYRDGPPCGNNPSARYATPRCPDAESPSRSMLGINQRDWFINQVSQSQATWKIWANEVMLMPFKILNTTLLLNPELLSKLPAQLREIINNLPPQLKTDLYFNLDQWDGYPAERKYIFDRFKELNIKNLVAITGDIHAYIAGYLKQNHDNLLEPPVGVELVVSSVSSITVDELIKNYINGFINNPNGPIPPELFSIIPIELFTTILILANNTHMRFINQSKHGYALMEVTQNSLRCTFKTVKSISSEVSTLENLVTFLVPKNQTMLIPYPFHL